MNAFATGVAIGIEAGLERLTELLRAASGCLLAGILLSGCAVVDKLPVFPKPKPDPEKPERLIHKSPLPAPQKLPRVTVLLSDDVPAYTGIKDELAAQLPQSPVIINLRGESASTADIIDRLNRAGNSHVVAVGPLAAQAASGYTAGSVVFCQVFNYQDLGLPAARMQGVGMLPPAELLFRAWKELDPGLQRAGVITGQGHEALIAAAREAALHHGIDIKHRVVQSDKEMLYAFKRLTPDIQGLWLVPDDRVLSRRVLRDIMDYSVKHHLQVVVFHPQLLRLGGLMSVSSVDADVAQQVIAALTEAPASTGSPATLLPLKKIQIEVNSSRVNEQARRSSLESRVAVDAP
jgi:hypothetical protein